MGSWQCLDFDPDLSDFKVCDLSSKRLGIEGGGGAGG